MGGGKRNGFRSHRNRGRFITIPKQLPGFTLYSEMVKLTPKLPPLLHRYRRRCCPPSMDKITALAASSLGHEKPKNRPLKRRSGR